MTVLRDAAAEVIPLIASKPSQQRVPCVPAFLGACSPGLPPSHVLESDVGICAVTVFAIRMNSQTDVAPEGAVPRSRQHRVQYALENPLR